MFNVIIAGSRNFNDYDLLKSKCLYYLQNKLSNITIISGIANGADKLGERFAKEYNLSIKQYPADWNKYGKSAGYLRNIEMAENAHAVIVFWDGKSKGTKHMIDISKKYNLLLKIVKYE